MSYIDKCSICRAFCVLDTVFSITQLFLTLLPSSSPCFSHLPHPSCPSLTPFHPEVTLHSQSAFTIFFFERKLDFVCSACCFCSCGFQSASNLHEMLLALCHCHILFLLPYLILLPLFTVSSFVALYSNILTLSCLLSLALCFSFQVRGFGNMMRDSFCCDN